MKGIQQAVCNLSFTINLFHIALLKHL